MKLKQALLHNTGWKMIAMLFTFLNNILIVRILGAEASANFFYALTVFILLSTILKFGLENGIIYFLSKKNTNIGAITILLFIVLLIQSILTVILLKLFIAEVAEFTLLWAILFVTGNIMLCYVNAFYQVKKMYISLNVISAAIIFLQCTSLLYLYYSPSNFLVAYKIASNNIDAMMLISSVAIFIQVLILMAFFFSRNKKDFSNMNFDLLVTKKIFSYSVINFVITVLFYLVMRADIYFVEKFCNKIDLSNYLQAAKIGQMLLVFPGLLAGVIFPYTIEAPKALAHKVAFLCRMLTFLYLFVYVVFLLFGRFVFIWLLGTDFNLMYEIFAISFFGVYCLSISLLFISYFEGINKLTIILCSLGATFTIIVFLNFLLVSKYGYKAAAVVFSGANLIGLIILFMKFLRITDITITDVLILKKDDVRKIRI